MIIVIYSKDTFMFFSLVLGVLEEARFFGVDSLIEHLEAAIKVITVFATTSFSCPIKMSVILC